MRTHGFDRLRSRQGPHRSVRQGGAADRQSLPLRQFPLPSDQEGRDENPRVRPPAQQAGAAPKRAAGLFLTRRYVALRIPQETAGNPLATARQNPTPRP